MEVIKNYTGPIECRKCRGAGSWPADSIRDSYLGTIVNHEWDYCEYCNGDGFETVKDETVYKDRRGYLILYNGETE